MPLLAALGCAAVVGAQQSPPRALPTPPGQLTIDDSFDPPIPDPAFPPGKGPIVVVDESHRNVVSLATYLRPVGRFLAKDGYVVQSWREPLTSLNSTPPDIVVIANAQAAEHAPPGTSAFSAAEVRALDAWVRHGGGFLLVADRAPFGGPAQSLARAFGVTLDDNTILRIGKDGKPTGELAIEVPNRDAAGHPVLARVGRIAYVVGESVQGPGVLLRAPAQTYSAPTNQATTGPPAEGKPLLLAFAHGRGRVVVLGDAGVVSAFGSVDGPAHRGISEADNARLVRNILHWLAPKDRPGVHARSCPVSESRPRT